MEERDKQKKRHDATKARNGGVDDSIWDGDAQVQDLCHGAGPGLGCAPMPVIAAGSMLVVHLVGRLGGNMDGRWACVGEVPRPEAQNWLRFAPSNGRRCPRPLVDSSLLDGRVRGCMTAVVMGE